MATGSAAARHPERITYRYDGPCGTSYDALLGVPPPDDRAVWVARIFSEERHKAGMGRYMLPPASYYKSTDRDLCTHVAEWAESEAGDDVEVQELAIRESVRGWLADKYVIERRPAISNWARDPARYRTLYREHVKRERVEERRRVEEREKEHPVDVMPHDEFTANISALTQKLRRTEAA